MAKSAKAKSAKRTTSRASVASKKSAKLPTFFGRRLSKAGVFALAFAVVGVFSVLVGLAATPPAGPVKVKQTGECLENFFNRAMDGNFLSTYPCNSTNVAQKWTYYPADKSMRTLGGRYCLDVQKGGKTPMTKVHLWRCTGGVPQKWDVLSNGTLRNPNSGLCLEASAENTFLGGPHMYVNTCNATNTRQVWTVPTATITPPIPTPPPTYPPVPAPTPTPTPTPSPTPVPSGRPGPDNTGPTGTLTPISGALNQAGKVYENVSITGGAKITASNITLRNFRVNGGLYGIQIADGVTGVVIERGEIVNFDSAGIIGSNWTARYLEIHESQRDGMKPGKNTVLEYSYMHHLGKATGAHADALQLRGSVNHKSRYNFCDIGWPAPSGYRSNACYMIEEGAHDVLIENNWLNGGNYTVNCEGGNGGFYNITIRNNYFGKSQYGRVAGCSSSGNLSF